MRFSGTKAGVNDNVQLVQQITKQHKSGSFEFTMNPKEKEALWAARKNSLWSMLAMREEDGQQIWSTDVAVPFSRLPDLIGKQNLPIRCTWLDFTVTDPNRNDQARYRSTGVIRQRARPRRRRQLSHQHLLPKQRSRGKSGRRKMRRQDGGRCASDGGHLHGMLISLPARKKRKKESPS